MKKLFSASTVFLLALLLSFFTLTAFAEDTSTTKNDATTTTKTDDTTSTTKPATVLWTYKTLSDGTLEITKYNGTDKVCNIPASLDGKTVTSVAADIIEKNTYVEEVTVPGTVKKLDQDSLSSCFTLKTVRVLDGALENINLNYCYNLETVYLSKNIKQVGTFPQSTKLQNFIVDKANTFIRHYYGSIYSKDGTTLIKYPAGKTATRFVVPSAVKKIADSAFYNTKGNIKEIYIPKTVTAIGEKAFDESYASILCQCAEKELPAECKAALIGKKVSYNVINLSAPAKVISSQTASTITLQWSKAENATGYRVYLKEGRTWKKLGDTAKTTCTFKKLPANTAYTFAIRPYNVTNKVVTWAYNYITHETATASKAPSKITAAQNTSAIKLKWTSVKDATGYVVYYKNSKGWKAYSTVTTNEILITKLSAGSKITFAIRPFRKTADVTVMGEYSTFTTCTKTEKPTVLGAINTKNKTAVVSWKPVKGAEKYVLYCRVNGQKWVQSGVYDEVKKVTTQALPVGTKVEFAVRGAIKTSSGYVLSDYKTISLTVK